MTEPTGNTSNLMTVEANTLVLFLDPVCSEGLANQDLVNCIVNDLYFSLFVL